MVLMRRTNPDQVNYTIGHVRVMSIYVKGYLLSHQGVTTFLVASYWNLFPTSPIRIL